VKSTAVLVVAVNAPLSVGLAKNFALIELTVIAGVVAADPGESADHNSTIATAATLIAITGNRRAQFVRTLS
jgi:hypothetical protein